MNYKAEKLKSNIKENNKIILVQSLNQAKIILNNKNIIFCFVPSLELHEFVMDKRKDNDFVKSVCRRQRIDIIDSGWDYKIYNNFNELYNFINDIITNEI